MSESGMKPIDFIIMLSAECCVVIFIFIFHGVLAKSAEGLSIISNEFEEYFTKEKIIKLRNLNSLYFRIYLLTSTESIWEFWLAHASSKHGQGNETWMRASIPYFNHCWTSSRIIYLGIIVALLAIGHGFFLYGIFKHIWQGEDGHFTQKLNLIIIVMIVSNIMFGVFQIISVSVPFLLVS